MEDSVDSASGELRYFLKQFFESVDQTQTARQRAELYRDYVDGKQWTDAERKTLEKRRQPCITDNRIKDKVEHLLGLERQARTDPKAFPRNPQDEDAADAATDALRYVSDYNDFPQVKSKVFDNILVEGFGGAEVIIEQHHGKPCITINHVRWDRIYYDPHALAPDFRDMSYCGIVAWMDLGRAKTKYPKLAKNFEALVDGQMGFSSDTYDDKPGMWVDKVRKRVQILEHYELSKGTWTRCVFSRAGIIEPQAPVVYVDEYQQPECPLILQSAYVEREGDRYGVVRRYKDLQDEVNKRRSKSLHLLSNNRVISEKGAVEDAEKARTEVARPDGFVEVTPGLRFDIVENRDLAAGQFNLLQDALTALGLTGPNAALEGRNASDSGRAQQIAQQAGVIQLGVLYDGIRYWQKRVMRAAWARARQFWNDEMWIRVTDDEKTRFVGLNRKVTQGELEAEKLKEQDLPPEQKMQMLQQIAANPAMQQQIVQNYVPTMDMDIIIDEAPDTVTLQQEQWTQLTELAKNGMPIPPETLIRASGLRNKAQLIDEIKAAQQQGGMPPQVQKQIQAAMQQVQDGQKQLQQQQDQLKQLELSIKDQATQLKVADAELTANRKIFASEVQVAKAELGAQAVTANAADKTRQAQFAARQVQARASNSNRR